MRPSIGEAREASTDRSIWIIVALATTQHAMLQKAGANAARHGIAPCASGSVAATTAAAAGAISR